MHLDSCVANGKFRREKNLTLNSPPISGVETDVDMSMEIVNGETRTETFEFHSAIAVSKDKTTVYACIAIRLVPYPKIKPSCMPALPSG